MPDGFVTMTLPFASRLPASVDAPGPHTRFSAVAEEFGWTKRVVSPTLMLNVCQSIAARCVVWLIVRVLPFVEKVAPPPTTVGFIGLAKAAPAAPKASAAATDVSAVEAKRS